ncbi:MAG: glutamate 5-kinase, partial [Stellaceae bacterium]
MSQTLAASKRLIVKIGSALLADDKTGEPRRVWLEALLADIAALRKTGTSVVIVTSGAVAIGRRHLKLPPGPLRLEEKQAAAAAGQVRLAHVYQEAAERHGIVVAQILLTPEDTEERRRHLNARAT